MPTGLTVVGAIPFFKREGGDGEVMRGIKSILNKLTLEKFDELDFLSGASVVASGPLAVLQYLDEDPYTPQIYFLAAGVRSGGEGRVICDFCL